MYIEISVYFAVPGTVHTTHDGSVCERGSDVDELSAIYIL